MGRDALPKLIQARLIESFENYDLAHAPLHAATWVSPSFSC
jgi:phospholipid/cholesterol/gamma-HCH transport system substrate-binding protein